MKKHPVLQRITTSLFCLIACSRLIGAAQPVAIPGVLNPVTSPILDHCFGESLFVLEGNETNGVVIFDGSRSFDPDGGALRFRWGTLNSDHDFFPLPGTTWSSSPYLTNFYAKLYPGSVAFRVTLEVANFGASAYSQLTIVAAVTPFSAMAACGEWVEWKFEAFPHLSRELSLSIEGAMDAFLANDFKRGIKDVEHFRKIVARLEKIDPEITRPLLDLSQAVLDVIHRNAPYSQKSDRTQKKGS